MPAARKSSKKSSKPPAARKPKKAVKPAGKAKARAVAPPARKAAAKPAPRAQPTPAQPIVPQPASDPGWVQVPEPTIVPLPPASVAPSAGAGRFAPTFDPRTGAWTAAAHPGAPVAAAVDAAPEASTKGSTSYIAWTVLLAIDLFAVTFLLLSNVVAGIILVATPHSALAQQLRDDIGKASPAALLADTLLTFLMLGVVPFLWVLGTRRVPVEGAKRYLHLKEPGKAILRGVLLAIPLLVGVAILSAAYTVATQGIDGLAHPDPSKDSNPAVEAILSQLTWPLAVVVALCAGVGEEIFFRGLLLRPLGVWGQAIVFGLAHSAGGYPPQVVFACALGVLFGFLVKRGWSLWSLMTAHFLYDMTLLAIGLVTR